MNHHNKILKEYVELIVERKLREVDISGNKRVQHGSDEHINDLIERCNQTEYWRNMYPYGSARRYHYATILKHLKNELKSARKSSDKQKQLNEKDEG